MTPFFSKEARLSQRRSERKRRSHPTSSTVQSRGKAKARLPGCAVTQGLPSARLTLSWRDPAEGAREASSSLESRLFPRQPQPEPLPGPTAKWPGEGLFLCLSCEAAAFSPARVSATAQRSKTPPKYQLQHRWRRLSEEEALPKRTMSSPPRRSESGARLLACLFPGRCSGRHKRSALS